MGSRVRYIGVIFMSEARKGINTKQIGATIAFGCLVATIAGTVAFCPTQTPKHNSSATKNASKIDTGTGRLSTKTLRVRLRTLINGFEGRIGLYIQDGSSTFGVYEDQRFSLQSVMKLIVAATAMDAVDRRGWQLSDRVFVRRQDLSLNIQPLAALVGDKDYFTTLGGLIVRAVVDSDSAASDILFARVGGAIQINAFLKRNGVEGMRVDRDERHLQTEIVGLTWHPEYVEASQLEQAKKRVSKAQQKKAFRASLKDPRDTATPKGMTTFLSLLVTGRLLSPTSTQSLLEVMRQTVTFPDRLKAGVPTDWKIAHKTGTSGTWEGVRGTINDVGILTTPKNRPIAVSVFIATSKRSLKEQSALIAEVARIITDTYKTN